MNRSKLLAAALLVCLPLVSHAQKGWYVGLDAGKSSADAEVEEYIFGGDVTAEETGTSSGIHLRGGYQFGRYFALELGYADFGDFDYSFDPDDCPFGNPGPCPFSVSTSFSGYTGSLVGILPLGKRWSLHGRFGIFKMNVASHQTPGGELGEVSDEEGLQYSLGAGLQLDEHWQFLFDYSKYGELDFGLGFNLVGDFGSYDVGDTRLLSIGINYHW